MKIMFICTGNICRSAMAHWLLERKLKELSIEELQNMSSIEVYSSGTNAFTGDRATEEAIEVMKEYGVDLSKHRATNIVESNIKEMDLILCATDIHKMQVLGRYPQLKDKIYTMKEYVKYNEIGKDLINIKDPLGYDIATYRICAEEIEKCIELLIKELEKKKKI